MSRFVLDTTVLVDISRGVEPVRRHVRTLVADGHAIATSAINVAEFYSGAAEGDHPDIDALLSTIPKWTITAAMAHRAATFRRALKHQGVALSLPDSLIAAAAAVHDATVLTANVRDFPIPGLRVERLPALT